MTAWEGRITIVAARIMRFIGKHWLLVANLTMLLLVGLPLVAPVLAHGGEQGLARAIHIAFTPFCHQLPERSFFLFGPQATYTADELSRVGVEALSRRFTGTPELGYKVVQTSHNLRQHLQPCHGRARYKPGPLEVGVRPLGRR